MTTAWLLDNKVIIDNQGRVILCDYCPCPDDTGTGTGTGTHPGSVDYGCCYQPHPAFVIPTTITALFTPAQYGISSVILNYSVVHDRFESPNYVDQYGNICNGVFLCLGQPQGVFPPQWLFSFGAQGRQGLPHDWSVQAEMDVNCDTAPDPGFPILMTGVGATSDSTPPFDPYTVTVTIDD